MFAKIWDQHDEEFDVALVNKDIDACHRIWCLAAETFLWERDNPNEDLPKGCCRRGSILKKKQVPVAQKTCDITRAPRNHFTNKIDGILGTAYDIKQRVLRIKKNVTTLLNPSNNDEQHEMDTVNLNFDTACALTARGPLS